ncbi:40s ribosomal protein s5-1 [Hordeum vulgare]|nr:40s ribosomal protein s5-1 [Hordeum vulgare]
MASPKALKNKIFEKFINPYLAGVLQHPQSIEMHEGVLHIRDVEGPKKTVSMEARLEAMEQQVFKCQGMVERGLNANHMMITEFTNKHKIDANDIGKHLSRLYDRTDHLQPRSMTCRTKTGNILELHLLEMSCLETLHVGSMGGVLFLKGGVQPLMFSPTGRLAILLLRVEKTQLLLELLVRLARGFSLRDGGVQTALRSPTWPSDAWTWARNMLYACTWAS